MIPSSLLDQAETLKKTLNTLTDQTNHLMEMFHTLSLPSMTSPFIMELTIFSLAVFVGYHVVWRVTPALHSPLMAVTNAISSVIIVGALLAAGIQEWSFSKFMGFLAVILASINIFGGFTMTHRMLSLFRQKDR